MLKGAKFQIARLNWSGSPTLRGSSLRRASDWTHAGAFTVEGRKIVFPALHNFSAAASRWDDFLKSSVDVLKHPIGHESWHSVSKMASTFRLGTSVLPRLATPSVRLLVQTRPFSASIPLRANDSRRKPGNAPASPARVNPLVGNYVPTQPVKPATEEAPAQAKTPDVKKVEISNAAPPPPPPPAAAEAATGTATESGSAEAHPYTAASKGPDGFNLDIASIIASKSSAYGDAVSSDVLSRPQIRAKAVTGRTVFIRDRTSQTTAPSPAIAFRVLNRMIRTQQVKNKFHSQKFHERKGLKRKRLRSERWRARFKAGFKATVTRVLELKKQGW